MCCVWRQAEQNDPILLAQIDDIQRHECFVSINEEDNRVLWNNILQEKPSSATLQLALNQSTLTLTFTI